MPNRTAKSFRNPALSFSGVSNPLRKPGRPANPYKSQHFFGKEGWSHHYYDPLHNEPNLATPQAPPGTPVEVLIIGLLVQAGPGGYNSLPLPRTAIEATLNVDHYVPPNAVTNALRNLCSRKESPASLQVYRTLLEVRGQYAPSHIYSVGRLPREAELKALRDLLELRVRELNPRLKGRRAEHYIWGLLRQSGRFKLNQKRKCGEIRDASGLNKIDILAEEESGNRFAISIKNERQWFHPGNPAIKDAFKKAKAHGAWPFFVAPHITPEAKARCNKDGILFLELRRQILPAELDDGRHMRKVVESLRPVLGPQAFDYIPKQFPRVGEQSPWVERDIDFIEHMPL